MITVALPVYNQSAILPVALESLCAQECLCKWELIICTEDDVSSIVEPYRQRLLGAGCIAIVLDILPEWTPLPQKWKRIGQQMHPDSLGMMLQAADCYGHKHRIALSYAAMLLGFDWYHERRGYFFDIPSSTLAEYRKNENHTFLNMCMAATHARAIPSSDLKRNIDFFLLSSIANPKIFTLEFNMGGVDFNGMQNISNARGSMISGFVYPFFRVSRTILDIIPFDVLSIALKAKKD
jgi:hypothetical protein